MDHVAKRGFTATHPAPMDNWLTPEQDIGMDESAYTLAEHHGWEAARWFVRTCIAHARDHRGISDKAIDEYFTLAIDHVKT